MTTNISIPLTASEPDQTTIARCRARDQRVRVTRMVPSTHNGLGVEEHFLTRRGWRREEDLHEEEKVTASYFQDRAGRSQERELVLFNGSETAFRKWRSTHELLDDDRVQVWNRSKPVSIEPVVVEPAIVEAAQALVRKPLESSHMGTQKKSRKRAAQEA